MVLTDSSRARSMKAQVLTTRQSAASAAAAISWPASVSIPSISSESTWFLGHPSVVKWTFMAGRYDPTATPAPSTSRAEPSLTLVGSFGTLPAMSANRTMVLIGVLLAAVALLAAAGPAMAHSSAPIIEPVPQTPEAASAPGAPSPAPAVTTPADSAGFTPGLTPWIAAGALV